MLIYNHKKEFHGIDQHDLDILGFANLEELKSQYLDFADMFVKTPGHVHNFKHVNWIDFVSCADSNENTKVIINANNKNFRCILDIKTIYLNDEPSSKAYLVYLNNIRALLDNGEVSDIPYQKPVSTPPPKPNPVYTQPVVEKAPVYEAPPAPKIEKIPDTFQAPIDLDSPLDLDFKDDIVQKVAPVVKAPETLKIDLNLDDEPQVLTQEPEEKIQTIAAPKFETVSEAFNNGYVFDPQVASDELGLPVDLIEEFIEDFIAQAKEFKDELYTSANENDHDNVKILSHKLKGVAANLRIEDALESLTTINTAEDLSGIMQELDTFYHIIAKLNGEEVFITKTVAVEEKIEVAEEKIEVVEEKEDLLIIPEDETLEIKDDLETDIFSQKTESILKEETPEPEIRINLAELADDTFKEETLDVSIPQEPKIDELVLTQESPHEEVPVISYDINLIASEIGLSQENFMELFEDYLHESNDLSDAISKAIEENNTSLWQRKAIQLKGMSDNMRVKEFTHDLETLSKVQDVEIAKKAHFQIRQALAAMSKIKG